MSRAGLVLFVALTLLGGPPATLAAKDRASGVAWFEGDLPAAIEKASDDGKLVLLDCWARWCKYCFDMDDDVWARADLARALEPEVVAVKAEVDRARGAGLGIAERYEVEGLPRVLVIDPRDGRLLESVEGYQDHTAILALVDRARTKLDEERQLENAQSAEALVTLGGRRLREGDPRAALEIFERAWSLDPDCALDQADDAALGRADALAKSRRAAEAEERLLEAAERCPGASGVAEIWARLVALASGAGPEKLGRLLDARVEALPDDVDAALEAGDWHLEQGAFERALELGRAAKALAPEIPDPLRLEARALLGLGRREEAAARVDEAIALDPHDGALRELKLRITLRR